MNELSAENKAAAGNAKMIYILYLIGILIGLTALIGVVMAYIYRKDAPEWLHSHYQFQIRTFWIGFLYLVIGSLTTAFIVGFLILLFWLVWVIVRCVKGMKALDRGEALADPTSWMF